MKSTKEKQEYTKFKRIYDYGLVLSSANFKAGYFIKSFSIKKMYEDFKINRDPEKETEIKILLADLTKIKQNYSENEFDSNLDLNLEEYLEFLENIFANVDDEDRYGEVNMKTAANFRMVGELVELISSFEEIPFEWQKRYLKNGLVPKRGNPNVNIEQDNFQLELVKEKNQQEFLQEKDQQDLMQENEKKSYSEEQVNNFFNRKTTESIHLEKDTNQNFNNTQNPLSYHELNNVKINNDVQDINYSHYDSQYFQNPENENPERNMNNNNISFKNEEYNINTIDNKSSNNNSSDIQVNLDLNKGKNSSFHFPSLETELTNSNFNTTTNDFPSEYKNIDQNIQQPILKKYDEKLEKDRIALTKIVEKNIHDFDISKFHKKLDFDLPVKPKTPNYYKLTTVMLKLLSNAKKEMESNNQDKSLETLELVMFYLNNMEK